MYPEKRARAHVEGNGLLICFSQSSNFQTDEYCRQMHLEVCEWNTSSAVQTKKFCVAKEDYKCFISIQYDKKDK